MLQKILVNTLVLVILGILPAQANVSVSLYNGNTPGGDLTGAPGSTVGWGVTIDNSEASWLQVNYSDFFLNSGSSHIGTYTDFVGPAYVVIAPTGTAPGADYYVGSFTSYYNSVAQTGAGSYTINYVAPGSQALGQIGVNFDLFNGNPIGGGLTAISTGTSYAPATVTTTAVPEPSTYVLLAIALGVVGYARKKMRVTSQG